MRPVVLLTDFGLDDHYVGVLHAVLVRDAPGTERLDLTHQVAPGDLWHACLALRCSWPHLPSDAVVLAVVDPGVGTHRRGVAIALGERWLVAPDNGLAAAVGCPDEAFELDWRRMGLDRPSATFHGRDLFAPAAARLARGDDPESLGASPAANDLIPCPLPDPVELWGLVRATILHVDRFGNLITNLEWARIEDGSVVRAGSNPPLRLVRTYGDGKSDEVVALQGSSGLLELAVNRGSAARSTGLGRGDPVDVSPPPSA